MTDLLADLRAKRDHYNAVEGNDDSMENLLEALDAFLDQPPSTDFERGAEAMREAAAAHFEGRQPSPTMYRASAAVEIRALPLPVQPPGSESREAEIDQAIEAERPRVRADAAQLAMRARDEQAVLRARLGLLAETFAQLAANAAVSVTDTTLGNVSAARWQGREQAWSGACARLREALAPDARPSPSSEKQGGKK